MKLEHFALNVEDPIGMSKWYVEHLGLQVVRQLTDTPFTTFLADDSGRVMIEVYANPDAEIPEYESMHPLIVHLAFVSTNPEYDKERLVNAGATFASEQFLQDGSHLVMLRDPWGLSIQFCKRGVPMLAERELTSSNGFCLNKLVKM
ncbi:catechol-2,3-dioxygenase [Pontibacter aydingkolensis]|uniref:VOC family protein n=1 Tax=Pontibacter aydingkolensis TaxID=1911536 RepID=A0ABS7CSN6_9BACT|nr:VOC family protein [Pontibacter aydingkolensis]MBW7466512.1 VOC family protein [Pontibacter aydingkolensis]